jgi:methionine-rich copper-binding protein CopC
MRKRSTGPVALLLASCLSLGAAAAPTLAHAKLVESQPAGGSVLEEAPEQLRLRFDEPVRIEESPEPEPSPLDPLQVYSEEGSRVDRNDTRVDARSPNVLVVGLKELPDGVYGVDWNVTSSDGHVLDGTFGFTVERAARPAQDDAEGSRVAGEEGSGWVVTMTVAAASLIVVGGVGAVLALRRR